MSISLGEYDYIETCQFEALDEMSQRAVFSNLQAIIFGQTRYPRSACQSGDIQGIVDSMIFASGKGILHFRSDWFIGGTFHFLLRRLEGQT